MTVSQSQSGDTPQRENILTLEEAAAYLRVEPVAVEQLVADHAIPARKIGGEWRFLRKALDDWLRFPGRHRADFWMPPPHGILDSPFTEELLLLLESRLVEKLRETASMPSKSGSKQAILKHFGAFREDDDLEERLADARKRRKAEG